ncbi:hypothetical protein BaRGS_00020226, partial [Batillaria attramentaria]
YGPSEEGEGSNPVMSEARTRNLKDPAASQYGSSQGGSSSIPGTFDPRTQNFNNRAASQYYPSEGDSGSNPVASESRTRNFDNSASSSNIEKLNRKHVSGNGSGPKVTSKASRISDVREPSAGGVTEAGTDQLNSTSCEEWKTWIHSPFDGSPCGDPHRPRDVSGNWEICKFISEDLNAVDIPCYCSGNYATCCGNLTRIPQFQPEILYLNFSHNGLATLDDDTLQNVTQLQWLILNKNHISHVTQNAFRGMTSLECLEMAHNNIRIRVRPKNFTIAVNKVSTLKLLALNFTQFAKERMKGPGVEYIMRNLRLPNLTKLFVSGGEMEQLYLSDVTNLINLQALSVASHSILKLSPCREQSFNADNNACVSKNSSGASEGSEGGSDSHSDFCRSFQLPSLRLLDLAYNLLVTFPNFCQDEKEGNTSVLPGLMYLSLSLNAIVNPRAHQMQCLPELVSLALTGNPLRRIKSRAFRGFPKLYHLDLRLHASNFHPDLFLGSNLTWLDLSYNVFRFVSPERLRQILKPLYTVRQLYMAELGLFNIPSTITSTFVDLEIFWFNANLVSGLQPNTFENLTRLTDLNLRDNLLTSPNIEAIRRLTRGKGRNVTVKVNLGWNPYSCTCDLLDFLHMLKRSYTEDTGGGGALGVIADYDTDAALEIVGDQFKCYSPAHVENTSLFDLEMTQQMCLLTVQQVIMIHCICIIAILAVVIYSVLYRYRWQVRFWLYTVHVRWNKQQDDHRPCHRSRYGAFVSYCQHDSNFILTKMLPSLECGYRLPLCIHERDFVPGRYISQNIVERMEESDHILLVLSNAFLRDDWCRFELFVAQQYGLIHHRIPITVLLLEPLDVELMDGHVIIMLQSPALEWPGPEGTDRQRDMFWRRLGESLTSSQR